MAATESAVKRPAEARPAATVILVRDLGGPPAVYLVRRSRQSGFMAGSFVFPGGKVDVGDRVDRLWVGKGDLSRTAVAAHLNDPSAGLSLLPFAVAAIRETWEEAGVLLADLRKGRAALLDTLVALRERRRLGPDWLREHLVARGGTLAFSALWPWSHWIAPEALKPRFDTRFFVARMPAGQQCRPDPRETPEGRWMTARDALEANARGELTLSPPTLVTLHELLAYPTVAALRAALPGRGWGPARMPKMCVTPAGPLVIQPWDAAFSAPDPTLPAGRHDLEPLPVGVPFSRLWNDEGTWRPVR